IFVSPEDLPMDPAITTLLKERGVGYEETTDFPAAVAKCDVLYMTRIPKEYFDSEAEYEKHKHAYRLTRELADSMKPDSIVMHPLPRVDEIAPEVDTSPHARYFKQAGNGVPVRMALLMHLLTSQSS